MKQIWTVCVFRKITPELCSVEPFKVLQVRLEKNKNIGKFQTSGPTKKQLSTVEVGAGGTEY